MDAHSAGAPRPTLAMIASAARVVVIALTLAPAAALGAAGYRTANFTVDAPTPQLAKEIGDSAESWRKSLAMEWLGVEMPQWATPCPIKAQVSPQLGAGGATSFVFDHGEVFDWRMNIQGSRERVLDSVLPHEITHTIFASYFRQPLPRWADEGACTTVEHTSEIQKQERMLIEFLHTQRGIPFSDMFAMREYPKDVLPLYAQGYALSEYLIGQRGRQAFLAFLADGMKDENWPRAVKEHYGYDHLLALQNSWLDWVRAGRPEIQPSTEAVAATGLPPQPIAAIPGGRRQATSASPVIHPQANDVTPTPAEPQAKAADDTVADVEWQAVPAGATGSPAASVYDASASTGTVLR